MAKYDRRFNKSADVSQPLRDSINVWELVRAAEMHRAYNEAYPPNTSTDEGSWFNTAMRQDHFHKKFDPLENNTPAVLDQQKYWFDAD